MQQLSDTLRSFGDILTTLADNISNTGGDELIESRYKLLYTLARHQNAMQKETFSITSSIILPKLSKAEDDLNTANIIIKTQGHTIQEKNRLIEDMEARLRDREDKIRKQIEEKAQLRLRLEEARNNCQELQDKLSTSDRLVHKHYKDAEFYKKELDKTKAELNNTKGLLDTYITMCTNLSRKNDENYAEYTKELALYKTAYPDIMLLPEGVKCPWEGATVISNIGYSINENRYILWGKGLLRCTGCNTQIHGRS